MKNEVLGGAREEKRWPTLKHEGHEGLFIRVGIRESLSTWVFVVWLEVIQGLLLHHLFRRL